MKLKRFHCNSGNKTKPVFEARYKINGSRHLEKVGEFPLDDYVQSFKESTTLDNIIRNYRNGDSSSLFAQAGAFGDFTSAPTSLADLLNKQIEATNLFNRMPVEVKADFNNDPVKFFCSMGSPEFDAILEKHSPKQIFDTPKGD